MILGQQLFTEDEGIRVKLIRLGFERLSWAQARESIYAYILNHIHMSNYILTFTHFSLSHVDKCICFNFSNFMGILWAKFSHSLAHHIKHNTTPKYSWRSLKQLFDLLLTPSGFHSKLFLKIATCVLFFRKLFDITSTLGKWWDATFRIVRAIIEVPQRDS